MTWATDRFSHNDWNSDTNRTSSDDEITNSKSSEGKEKEQNDKNPGWFQKVCSFFSSRPSGYDYQVTRRTISFTGRVLPDDEEGSGDIGW